MKCNGCKNKHNKYVLNLGQNGQIIQIQFLYQLRSSIPPNIKNEEDYSIEETGFTDFKKWCISKIDTKFIYKTSWVQSIFNYEFSVRTVEQTYC